MNRINRISSILIHLQSKKIVTAKELAERFNISVRTVYRDIRTLEEAGVPIGNEPSKGYFLVEGFHLPPVMFTLEEVSALISSGKVLSGFGDASLLKNYFGLRKVETTMNNENTFNIYLEQKPEEFQAIAKRLTEIVLSSHEDMTLEIKWGKPTFGLNGDFHHWICAVQILKNKVSLIFHYGGLLDDEKEKFITGTSKFLRKLEYNSLENIDEGEILGFIQCAIEKFSYFKDNWKKIKKNDVK